MKTKKVQFIFLWIFLSVFSQAFFALAEDAPKFSIIKSRDIEPFEQARRGFESKYREKWPNATFSVQSLEGKNAEALFDDVRAQKPALVLAIGSAAALAAREQIKTTPVLFTMVLEPERSGLQAPGIAIKVPKREKIDVARRLLPGVKRIGMIYSSDTREAWEETKSQAEAAGFEAIGSETDSGEKLPALFEDIASRIDVFFMVADSKLYAPKTVELLLLASIKRRVPVVGLSSSYTKAGALVSLEYDHEDSGRAAADMAIRIVGGENPASVGYGHPSDIRYSLNVQVAEQMKISIPEDVLKGASEVFGQ